MQLHLQAHFCFHLPQKTSLPSSMPYLLLLPTLHSHLTISLITLYHSDLHMLNLSQKRLSIFLYDPFHSKLSPSFLSPCHILLSSSYPYLNSLSLTNPATYLTDPIETYITAVTWSLFILYMVSSGLVDHGLRLWVPDVLSASVADIFRGGT